MALVGKVVSPGGVKEAISAEISADPIAAIQAAPPEPAQVVPVTTTPAPINARRSDNPHITVG